MALDYVSTSKKIVDAVGGAGNIASATNCMTRLRLVLNDESKANDDAVKGIKGVKSVIKQGGQYQVVIGNEVSNLMKEFNKLGNFSEDAAPAADKKPEGNPVQRLFGFVAGCLTPLLPAMLGTGMTKVLLTLLTATGVLSTANPTYILLYAMADSFFYFLPVMLGWSIAKKTGHSVPMYMVIGAMLVYPNLIDLLGQTGTSLFSRVSELSVAELLTELEAMVAAGEIESASASAFLTLLAQKAAATLPYGTFLGQDCTYMFGFLPVICASYSSSVLPMLLMVPVMGWAEDFADRVSPNVLKAFLKPMLFFLICTPVVLVVLGPLGTVLGQALAAMTTFLYGNFSWLTVGLLSAAMPFIVMTGMHYALIPLCMQNMATLGYDVVILVTMFCSNIAQGGAAFGVAARTKDEETRSEGIACGISATIAGVTEPAMYGINMRFMKPMIAAVCGAGVSGLLAGLASVKGFSMGGSPCFTSIITFIGVDAASTITNPYHGVIWGAICGVLSLAISFVLTFILFNDKDAGLAGEVNTDAIAAGQAAMEGREHVKQVSAAPLEIDSPMTGKLVPMKDVPDEVFASGALGEGIAILPTDGKVIAPCDGVVAQMMDSRHAIGMVADNGVEILIHVGLDTVQLHGTPFKYHVKADQEVKKGDLLLTADLDAVTKAGKQLYTPVIITNSDDYTEITPVEGAEITAGQKLMTVK